MEEDEVCGICRVQFDGTCPTCKYPGDDCPLREYNADPILEAELMIRSHRQMCSFFSHGGNPIKSAA